MKVFFFPVAEGDGRDGTCDDPAGVWVGHDKSPGRTKRWLPSFVHSGDFNPIESVPAKLG